MKTKSFFITGLPRSRTAWLANYFTTGSVLCLHEASYEEFLDRKNSGLWDYVGLSSTKLYEDIEKIDGPVLVVKRDLNDVYKWAKDYCSIDWLKYLNAKLVMGKQLTVDFDDIDISLEVIQGYLTPSIPYDEVRAELMMNYNVQVTEDRIEGLIK